MPNVSGIIRSFTPGVNFVNDGEIDIRGVTTFGLSAKESKSPIGFFGTGLKYAIAVILREGGKITIWSGTTRYDFEAGHATMRGKEFQPVMMNGSELGFTLHLGANWTMEHAFRELYCNAIDEGGRIVDSDVVRYKPGRTVVQVIHPDMVKYAKAREEIVMTDKPISGDGGGLVSIHKRRPDMTALYYRGIKASQFARPFRNTYNILAPMDLSEDRTLKYNYLGVSLLARAVITSTRKGFIEKVIVFGEHEPAHTFMEYSLDYANQFVTPSEEFLEVVDQALARNKVIPPQVLELYRKRRNPLAGYTKVKLTSSQDRMLHEAICFATEEFGYDPDEFPVTVVRSLPKDIMGTIDGKKLLLSEQVFVRGETYLFGTLLEEYFHARHGFKDETREFQDFLINALVAMTQEKIRWETGI